jgi:hypothetical protein
VRHVLALVVGFCVAFTGPAALRAEGRPALRVLLVLDRINDPLMARIQAEIAALGLTVVIGNESGPLESSARGQRALAAVRVLPSRKGVEVWMADATTGRTLTRQLVVDERPDGPDQTLVALQTAEILRTGLFPKENKVAPALPTVVAAPALPPRSDEWRLRNGTGGLYSPGGVDTAMQDWLTLQLWWQRNLGVAFAFSLPILRGSISGLEGRSLVGGYLGAVELCTSFLEADSRWLFTGGLGGGIVYLRTTGQSRPPLVQNTAGAFTGIGYARVALDLKLAKWVRLGIASIAGTTLAPVTIRFAGNQAGTWGRLILASFLQFGVDWK